MVTYRLVCQAFWVDVRLREINGRWIASADTPDGQSLGLGDVALEAITQALAPFDGIVDELLSSIPPNRGLVGSRRYPGLPNRRAGGAVGDVAGLRGALRHARSQPGESWASCAGHARWIRTSAAPKNGARGRVGRIKSGSRAAGADPRCAAGAHGEAQGSRRVSHVRPRAVRLGP